MTVVGLGEADAVWNRGTSVPADIMIQFRQLGSDSRVSRHHDSVQTAWFSQYVLGRHHVSVQTVGPSRQP